MKDRLLLSKSIRTFIIYLALIVVFNIAVATLKFPISIIDALSVIATIVAISLPILALFEGSKQNWTFTKGMIHFLAGIVLQFGLIALAQIAFKSSFSLIIVTLAFSQAGLVLWCLGLGSTVSLLIHDKNLILPITIFLALIDIFMVLTPVGFTQKIMEAAPQVLKTVALTVPTPTAQITHEPVVALAYVGPADLIFIGMFFAALYRFEVNARRTLFTLMPTLAAYLLVVIFLGGLTIGRFSLHALPALVPIGTVVLLANIKEFQLSRDEKLSTLLVLGLATGGLIWGLTRPPKQPDPKQTQLVEAQSLPESAR